MSESISIWPVNQNLERQAIEPNYSLLQAQHNEGNPDGETKEVNPPGEHTLIGRLYTNYHGHVTKD